VLRYGEGPVAAHAQRDVDLPVDRRTRALPQVGALVARRAAILHGLEAQVRAPQVHLVCGEGHRVEGRCLIGHLSVAADAGGVRHLVAGEVQPREVVRIGGPDTGDTEPGGHDGSRHCQEQDAPRGSHRCHPPSVTAMCR